MLLHSDTREFHKGLKPKCITEQLAYTADRLVLTCVIPKREGLEQHPGREPYVPELGAFPKVDIP